MPNADRNLIRLPEGVPSTTAAALGGRVVAVSRSQEKLDQATREGANAVDFPRGTMASSS
jgi:hypothetical protein